MQEVQLPVLMTVNDLMRTCADIVGYSLSDDAAEDSFSMLPLFAGEFSELSRTQLITISPDNRVAFREENWKLIISAHTRLDPIAPNFRPICELYDLATDPGEKTDLAAENKDRVASMIKSLQETFDQGRSTPGAPRKNDSNFRLQVS